MLFDLLAKSKPVDDIHNKLDKMDTVIEKLDSIAKVFTQTSENIYNNTLDVLEDATEEIAKEIKEVKENDNN